MRSIVFLILFISTHTFGKIELTQINPLSFNEEIIREDLELILKEAALKPESFKFTFIKDVNSSIRLTCVNNKFHVQVKSTESEMTSSVYKAMRELGFLFPHPRKQIFPTTKDIKKQCQKTWTWKPALKYRGFHLHTLHPNEWVAGFYGESKDISEALVRWLARNQQNILDLSLLESSLEKLIEKIKPQFDLAQKFQIFTGVSLGVALNQQNSYKLLHFFETFTERKSKIKIKTGLEILIKSLPLSYIVLEAGTSEFTPTNFQRTIDWLNLAGEITSKNNLALFTKVHVSSNQKSEEWGNFNFLPQHCDSTVGILPHTVMFYGLLDQKAPMYGNKNFYEIRDFMNKEKSRRPTWYYPESSYWVGMDVDIPLYLTDYLRTRAEDMKFLFQNGIEGQLNFTSGHVLGYWSFDWTMALLNDLDYDFNPLIGLKFLTEDQSTWDEILEYQKVWYKEKGLISLLSSANLQDELSQKHRIHDRFTMRDLSKNSIQLEKEISLLKESINSYPHIEGVNNSELKELLKINLLRHYHALAIRQALRDQKQKEQYLTQAKIFRLEASEIIKRHQKYITNYPEIKLFERWKNPTSYQFGYAYPAAILYFWEREENQIREDSYFPFKNNMYEFLDIIF